MAEQQTITVPVPQVAPLGWEVDTAAMIQDVWDAFVKPDQDAGMPQSIEMRMLMAILRSFHKGLADREAVS